MISKIGITEKQSQKSNSLLSMILSEEMTIYIKTRKFHWNVAGESFIELHKLFESQYTELEVIIDTVAERIGKLRTNTIGTMNEFTLLSRIVEHPNKHPIKKVMISELLSDHETLINELRKKIDICSNENYDARTADLLTVILQRHETTTWTLRRYLS